MTISTMRDGSPTSSSSRGFVSWILSNVVRPAFTRVVLRVRPWEEGRGGGWQYITHAYMQHLPSLSPYQSCPAVLKYAWNFPTACRYNIRLCTMVCHIHIYASLVPVLPVLHPACGNKNVGCSFFYGHCVEDLGLRWATHLA